MAGGVSILTCLYCGTAMTHANSQRRGWHATCRINAHVPTYIRDVKQCALMQRWTSGRVNVAARGSLSYLLRIVRQAQKGAYCRVWIEMNHAPAHRIEELRSYDVLLPSDDRQYR